MILIISLIIILLLFSLLWGNIKIKNKLITYESGFIGNNDQLYQYYVKYFFIALLFLIFDIEIILFYTFSSYLLILPFYLSFIFIFYIIYFTLLWELIVIGL